MTEISKLGKGNIISIQSSVSYGHAGNSSAVFPMQRLGFNVSPVYTVLFSNHTGYGKWGGSIVDTDVVKSVIDGMDERGVFPITDAIVSGYMGATALGDIILDTVGKVKQKNPNALYVCDPVFGDVGRGVFVNPELPEYFRDKVLPNCNICTPNMFELEWLTDTKIKTIDDAINSAKMLLNENCRVVLLTSLEHEKTNSNKIEMLAVCENETYHIETNKIDMPALPSGSGDATTALFTCHYLETNGDIKTSLEKTASGIYEIFNATAKAGTWELQIVASGDKLVNPDHTFVATKI
ncbi:MAG: pyridoxal kinase PdxY [Alphaproteobacteria bacterium]